ncbi:MAG TPA: PQQ-binding-like beta-propeller repeat protein [Pirellulales bacterium]
MPRLPALLGLCLTLLAALPAVAQTADPASAPPATAKPTVPPPTPAQTALVQAWQTRARLDSSRARLSHLVLQGNVLFAQSDRADVEAIDAETGRSLWNVIVGNANYPSVPVAAFGQHVAVVNGSTLYALDRSTGGVQWTRQLKGSPSAGPAITADRVYLPMLSGALEVYMLAPKTAVDRAALIFFGQGATEAPPLVSESRLMWGTRAGNVYIDALTNSTNRVRFVAGGPVVGRLAHRSPRIFFASLDGFVYAIDDLHGNKLWQFALGGPSRQPPVAVGESLYVVADSGGMWKVAADSGTQQWFVPGVRQFLAASASRIYASNLLGQLLVLDSATGSQQALYDTIALPIKYLNRDTDRVYLGNSNGYLSCFHEAGLSQPLGHTAPPAKQADTAAVKKKPAAAAANAAADPPAAKADDPFAK